MAAKALLTSSPARSALPAALTEKSMPSVQTPSTGH